MAIHGLPPSATVVGKLELVQYIDEGGTGIVLEHDMSKELVIGCLTAALDRQRDERRLEWDTCPECGRLWSEHNDDAEDDEE